jgi:hypothetical protein
MFQKKDEQRLCYLRCIEEKKRVEMKQLEVIATQEYQIHKSSESFS